MPFTSNYKQSLFSITEATFEEKALELFEYQAYANGVYKEYLSHLKCVPSQVTKLEEIPFLPIEFYKYRRVISGNVYISTVFESSGTTGQVTSKHFVSDLDFYKEVSRVIFEKFFGPLIGYTVLGLLPSYLERQNSSLVFMAQHFIELSKSNSSGFFLTNTEALTDQLKTLNEAGLQILLLGVTFALLSFAEGHHFDLGGSLVIETGGMKGRGVELIREEIYEILNRGFRNAKVRSEYGMTEMLSQAYSNEAGEFLCCPWMKVVLRNTSDPFEKGYQMKRGGINVIDLANVDSCAFIETKDYGELVENQRFKVLGRLDNSELRGCNLLI